MGAAIAGDKQKLESYNLDLKSIPGIQTKIKIPVEDCDKPTPSLFDVANFVLGTNLQKGEETLALRSSGRENYPLTYERIKYAALDARVSFEIAARSRELVAKPSRTENAAPVGGHYGWMNYFISCKKNCSLSVYIDIDGLFRWCACLWNK